MTSAVFSPVFVHESVGLGLDKVVASGDASRSRSTSPGSYLSEGQGSLDLEKVLSSPPKHESSIAETPLYPFSTTGLPAYDYPVPWSIQQQPQLPEIDYPMPFIVKHTFIGTDVLVPASLEEFYEERRTQSCPASGIFAPPGLEHVIEPEEAAANLRAAMAETNDMPHLLPEGLLDGPSDYDVSCSLQHPAVLPFLARPATAEWEFTSFPSPHLQDASPVAMPLLLDSLLDPPLPQSVERVPSFKFSACAPTFTMPTGSELPEPELGSSECPTIGSQGHGFGACKPCAFLYTKGCGNGISCSFCHLCDAGEKKRRSKDKRTALRTAKQFGYML